MAPVSKSNKKNSRTKKSIHKKHRLNQIKKLRAENEFD